MRERERERENLFDFTLRTYTIIRLIINKKNHFQQKPGSIEEPFGYRVEMLPEQSINQSINFILFLSKSAYIEINNTAVDKKRRRWQNDIR